MTTTPAAPAPHALLRPALSGLGLLAAGTAGLQARAVLVMRGEDWRFYRQEHADFLRAQARAAAGHGINTWTGPIRPEALTVWRAIEAAATTGLTLLVAGLGSLLLIALGRRLLWVPVAVGALAVAPVGLVSAYDTKTGTAVGIVSSLAVIALAAVPLLLALRTTAARRPIPAAPAALVLAGASVLSVYLMISTGNSSFASPSGPLAVLAFGMLVGGSGLPVRWLPLTLLLPLLGLTQISDVLHSTAGWSAESELTALVITLGLLGYLGLLFVLPLSRHLLTLLAVAPFLGLPPLLDLAIDAAHGYFPGVASFFGPVVITLAAGLLGAAVPLYGNQLVSWWRAGTHRGPRLSLSSARRVAA